MQRLDKDIPNPTLARFPKYYHVISTYESKNKGKYVSSIYLAKCLGMDDSQVRRDMMYLDIEGRPRLGYDTEELKNILAHYMGYNNINEAVLVGAGHLGMAIANYGKFEKYGLKVIAIFDKSKDKIGTKVGRLTVRPMDDFATIVKRKNIRIGIITTPEEAAQKVADTMISVGITAIWNFAPLRLSVPEDIFVQYENLAESFAFIAHYLKQKDENAEEEKKD